MWEASGGKVRLWDVRPELPGTLSFVRWAAAVGRSHQHRAHARHLVGGALGSRCTVYHWSPASMHVRRASADRRRRLPDRHLTNSIRVEDRVVAEIIPEGVHVHPFLVEQTLRCKGFGTRGVCDGQRARRRRPAPESLGAVCKAGGGGGRGRDRGAGGSGALRRRGAPVIDEGVRNANTSDSDSPSLRHHALLGDAPPRCLASGARDTGRGDGCRPGAAGRGAERAGDGRGRNTRPPEQLAAL